MFKFKAGDLLKLKMEYRSLYETHQFAVYLVVKTSEDIFMIELEQRAPRQRYYELLVNERIRAWGADNIEAMCVKIDEKEE